MTSHTLRFQRKPKAKERPRLGRGRRAFTPATTIEWEQDLAAAWQEAGLPKVECPVEMEIEFHKDEVVITITELPEERRSKLRGDVDNYTKIVMDGLNEIAYVDDRQVVVTRAEKVH